METRHVEIERFSKKAAGYKAAIEAAPHARALECAAIAAVLYGHCRRQNLDPACVTVLDVMSGTGYLSLNLLQVGFKKVHAVEACAEMLPVPSALADGITMHSVTEIEEVPALIARLKPSIVVSLAGFHHLIAHDGRNVDRFRSVLWQYRLIDLCVRELSHTALMIVVDIAEAGAGTELGLLPVKSWEPSVFRSFKCIGDDLQNLLETTKNIEGFSTVISSKIVGLKENPALTWFREVVNRETTIGHDDIALSRELLVLLSMHHVVNWSSFSCPWLFTDKSQLAYYVVHKFGFNIERADTDADNERIVHRVADVAGLHQLENGRIAMGWNLAMLALQGTRGMASVRPLVESNIALLSADILLLCRMVVKISNYGLFQQIATYVDAVVFVLLGVVLTGVLGLLVGRDEDCL